MMSTSKESNRMFIRKKNRVVFYLKKLLIVCEFNIWKIV